MKIAWVLVTVLVAVVLQVTLARYTVGGRWVFDLVLVGVVYAALLWGPGRRHAGRHDWRPAPGLGSRRRSVGGLAKTLVGFAAGVVGTQFVLVRPRARMIVVAGATVVHRLLIVGLLAIIDSSQQPTWHWSGVPWAAMLAETLMNSICRTHRVSSERSVARRHRARPHEPPVEFEPEKLVMDNMTGSIEDRRGLQIRLVVIRVVTSIGFLALAISFWVLQVVEHDKYKEMADNNHLRTIPLRAPRGVLFDRDGRVLVENRYSFTIAIIRERSANVERRGASAWRPRSGADEALLAGRHAAPQAGPAVRADRRSSSTRRSRRSPRCGARGLELPEVVVQQVPTRAYPPGGFAAHLFGYVSEIQEAQLDRPEFAGAAVRRDRRSGRAREGLQREAHGHRRRSAGRRQQRGARDRQDRRGAARRRAAHAAHDRRRPAARARRRVSRGQHGRGRGLHRIRRPARSSR